MSALHNADDTTVTSDRASTEPSTVPDLRVLQLLPAPGELVDGAYRVIMMLGHGGRGSVLLAQDETLDRRVALKMTHPGLAAHPHALDAFREEAQRLAAIDHPNVVRVYAYGEDPLGEAKQPYYVMQYMPGGSLLQQMQMRRTPLPVARALSVIDQVCAGVAAIHEGGFEHLDLKPSNILLGRSDRVAISDIGVQSWIPPGDRADAYVGTPSYCAPEIMAGCGVGAALYRTADVYAIGTIAFELLTGTRPFVARGLSELIRLKQAARVPLPHRIRRDLPHRLHKPLAMALSADPACRYQDPSDFAMAIREALETCPSPSRPGRSRRERADEHAASGPALR